MFLDFPEIPHAMQYSQKKKKIKKNKPIWYVL